MRRVLCPHIIPTTGGRACIRPFDETACLDCIEAPRPNLHLHRIAPYACGNRDCVEYNVIKLVSFEEIAPGLLVIPLHIICAECGHEVPRVKWSTLDE